MSIITVGIDLAKYVFAVHGVDDSGKNDAADAAAICEAVTRSNMMFVPIKEEHQQIILTLHRTPAKGLVF